MPAACNRELVRAFSRLELEAWSYTQADKLTLDPDFHLRKNDASKAPMVAEYER
jgi:hypothetical protein